MPNPDTITHDTPDIIGHGSLNTIAHGNPDTIPHDKRNSIGGIDYFVTGAAKNFASSVVVFALSL